MAARNRDWVAVALFVGALALFALDVWRNGGRVIPLLTFLFFYISGRPKGETAEDAARRRQRERRERYAFWGTFFGLDALGLFSVIASWFGRNPSAIVLSITSVGVGLLLLFTWGAVRGILQKGT
jgi:hypothetical protein